MALPAACTMRGTMSLRRTAHASLPARPAAAAPPTRRRHSRGRTAIGALGKNGDKLTSGLRDVRPLDPRDCPLLLARPSHHPELTWASEGAPRACLCVHGEARDSDDCVVRCVLRRTHLAPPPPLPCTQGSRMEGGCGRSERRWQASAAGAAFACLSAPTHTTRHAPSRTRRLPKGLGMRFPAAVALTRRGGDDAGAAGQLHRVATVRPGHARRALRHC
jgi:hypothetical protein